MTELLNCVAEAFLKYKCYACCIPASIILHELLPNSKLVKGFLNMNNKYSTWHAWVEHDGLILDPGKTINFKYHNMKNVVTFQSTTPFYERVDLDTEEEIKINKQNEMLFDLYQKAPAKYWNLVQLDNQEAYNTLVNIYNTLSTSGQKRVFQKQKVNDPCNCKSNLEFTKCCKQMYDTHSNVK